MDSVSSKTLNDSLIEMPLHPRDADSTSTFSSRCASPTLNIACDLPSPLSTLSTRATALLILCNIACSVAIVLVNKSILAIFHYPLTLTLCHQAFSWAATSAMMRISWLSRPDPRTVSWRDALSVGFFNVIGLFLMNASLQYNSVSVYQLSKMTMIPAIAAFQWILFQVLLPSRNIGYVLVLIMIGVGMATVESFSAHPFGLFIACLAVVTTAVSQVMLQHFPSFKALSGMQSVAVLSPYNSAVLLSLFLVVDLPQMASSTQGFFNSLASAPWINMFLTCVLAIGANYFGNTLIMRTSALTYNVVGHLKTILILAAGYLSFTVAKQDELNVIKFVGIILSLIGMGLYTRLQMLARSQDKLGQAKNDEENPLFSAFKNVEITRSTCVQGASYIMFLILAFVLGTYVARDPSQCAATNAKSVAEDARNMNNIPTWTANIWNSFTNAQQGSESNTTGLNQALVWDARKEQPLSDVFKRQGERVLIMSADSRPLQSFKSVGWDDPGRLNHQTMSAIYGSWWAMRHGYDYRRVQISQPQGFHGTWAKIKAIYDALFRYDLVVFFDGDAFVSDPSKSLTNMMDELGFHRNASLLLAREPPGNPFPNTNGTNTGFVVVRSTKVAKAALQTIMYCAFGLAAPRPTNDHDPYFALDEKQLNECKSWGRDWAHEQTVFNWYIRPLMKEGAEFIPASCSLVNGWWNIEPCKGKLVTHAWSGKPYVAGRMRDTMASEMVRLHLALLQTSYHITQCDVWSPGQGERCVFPGEDINTNKTRT